MLSAQCAGVGGGQGKRGHDPFCLIPGHLCPSLEFFACHVITTLPSFCHIRLSLRTYSYVVSLVDASYIKIPGF